MPISQVRFLVLFAAFSMGCSTGPETPIAPPEPEVKVDEALVGLNRILWIEDRRSDAGGELAVFARSEHQQVRAMAMQALGRFPFPEHGQGVTDELLRGLTDDSPEIQALAAFGLGLRADPASSQAVLEALKGTDERVVARLVEAAGHFDDPDLRREVLYATDHASAQVRVAAVRAPANWSADLADAAVVDSALVNVASRAPARLLEERWEYTPEAAAKGKLEDLEVVWSALFSLERRNSERAREVYYLWCRADESLEARIFATRGLCKLPELGTKELSALYECLEDGDWRVATEAAAGLRNFPSPEAHFALKQALKNNSSHHVQLAALDSLGYFDNTNQSLRQLVEGFLTHPEAVLRAQAVRSLARLQRQRSLKSLHSVHRASVNPVVLKALAQATEFLDAKSALPLLDQLVAHDSMSVAFAAAEGFGKFLKEGGREAALKLLKAKDYGLRLGAVLSLKQGPIQSDLEALARCYRTSDQDNLGDEIRMEILELVAGLKGPGVQGLMTEGLESKRPYIQALAHRLLLENFEQGTTAHRDPVRAVARQGDVPRLLQHKANPTVSVTTNRGTLTFELFPTEAPLHVHNFLVLARTGDYQGLTFHRVVSDFVVQGADFRGDGNGARSWRREPLRHEFNGLKYTHGSLGMPRNGDPDSGGSQWFVTHRPTPHLDGRYTLFGQLTSDPTVLDRIREGDTIKRVTIRGE
jgi:cyclophilin family peptidyl-prolyl cis-trans isomerase/HEAT repeat protein